MKNEIKIAIFGDSISEGIGKLKINYTIELEKLISNIYKKVKIDNYAHTGTTIKYLKTFEEEYKIKHYDIVIIGYGNVDGMLRPNLSSKYNIYKYLPNRYKKNGMLNPRPYYSNKIYKKIFQKIDSLIRWNLNRILLKIQGTTTLVSLEEFQQEYFNVIEKNFKNTKKIILLSTVKVSDKYFPGTNDSYEKYNEKIQILKYSYKNIKYIDLYNSLNKKEFFYEDLFHPNSNGYKEIAKLIYKEIKGSKINDKG